MATDGSENLTKLQRRRRLVRSSVTKTINCLKEDGMNSCLMNVKLKALKELATTLRLLDEKIFDEMLNDATDEELEEESTRALEIRERIIGAQLVADERISAAPDQSVSYSNSSHRSVKLPKLSLEKFELSPKNWLSWWSQFKSIHESEELENQIKFQYLRLTLTGPARFLVDSYPNTDENYLKALDHLKSRFGREDLIVRDIYKELVGLVREKPSLSTLYDKINAKVRCLETIGISSDRTAILIPLIEECLPIEVRREWERKGEGLADRIEKIDSLLEFLRKEAEYEERLGVVAEAYSNNSPLVTTAALVSADKPIGTVKKRTSPRSFSKPVCLFCKAPHRTSSCKLEMPVEKRREIVREAKACFARLRAGHSISKCRLRVDCNKCKGRHYDFMCNGKKEEKNVAACLLSGSSFGESIVLKTLKAYACFRNELIPVRILLDSASHRSYASSRVCRVLQLKAIGKEMLKHMLFGGVVSEMTAHDIFAIRLKSTLDDKYFQLQVLEQKVICGPIPAIRNGELFKRIAKSGVALTEDDAKAPIDILIGADALGRFLTGNTRCIDERLIALETVLGWCLLGAVETSEISPCLINSASSLVCLPNLWQLETLGIEPPKAESIKREVEEECLVHFEKTIRFKDGRYAVTLPWIKGHPALPTNKALAENRLRSVVNRLRRNDLYEDYDAVFKRWEAEGIIERSFTDDEELGHYLPHRPVVREGKTTKIRPVFDASAKQGGDASLNECLFAGPNLINEILPLLLRFRSGLFGATADIRQAFLMIELYLETDRNMLKFLWYDREALITYRHCRVVFGLSPSPFLLNATLKFHLQRHSNTVSNLLQQSLYIDDCIISLNSLEEIREFKKTACLVLEKACFELRGWTVSGEDVEEHSVLGLCWMPKEDKIACFQPKFDILAVFTKRSLLSLIGRFFDPLGLLAAPLLVLKLILQECFKLKLSWNDSIPSALSIRVTEWLTDINDIRHINVPRCIKLSAHCDLELVVFSDASQKGLGVCVFLRSEIGDKVKVSFVVAKARVCPIERLTIPRLELVAAGMAARLGSSVSETLKISKITYWVDSMIVLSWIKKDEWKGFVGNRIKEIRKLTSPAHWRFVEGSENPADLLSRGCSLSELKCSNWWDGPAWLQLHPNAWPKVDIVTPEEALVEGRIVSLLNVEDLPEVDDTLFSYFSSFRKNVRLMGWLLRFSPKTRHLKGVIGELSAEELTLAERRLFLWMQKVWKPDASGFETFFDEEGLLRLRSKVLSSQFPKEFRTPVVLVNCSLVEALIMEKHRELYHAGSCWVLSYLRERIWILKGRKVVRKVLRLCLRCQKHRKNTVSAPPIGLPDNRVNPGKVFNVSGCDLMGPLFLRGYSKVWVVLFTCAVYRAVHLEIVDALSTEAFMLALRRMIARRGIVSVMYSDHGTNFTGIWHAISKTEVENKQIKWIFNKTVAIYDTFCNRCRLIPYRTRGKQQKETVSSSNVELFAEPDDFEPNENLEDPNDSDVDGDFFVQLNNSSGNGNDSDTLIELPIKRVISTHKYCIFCQSGQVKKIPLEARLQAFSKKKIFIPDGDRCCEFHLIGNRFYEDELSNLRVYSHTSYLNPQEVSLFLEQLAEKTNSSLFHEISDFSMPEEQLTVFTGLKWENITKLREMMTSMRDCDTRSVTQALVVFLMKLTTGKSNRLIASILGIHHEQSVSNFCNQIVSGFEKDILPFHFGFDAVQRKYLIENHTTYIAKKLFNITEQLMLIFDGTYIRHQKSSNNSYQRKSFSGQKKVPLCKPFTVCCTDGYIVDIPGPFYGTLNDAKIMKNVLENPHGLKKLLQPGDLFLVDRGFRDIEQQIKDEGYIPLMPAFKGKRAQLTTEESNNSRRITKLRWVVEAVHGSIGQKYKLLHYTMDNKMLPKVKALCKIAGFLHNTFGKRLGSDSDLADEVLEQMSVRMNTVNSLSEEVESQRWNRKKVPFQVMKATDITDFPELSERQLKILFTGSYQLSQATSYLAELIGDRDSPQLQFLKESPNIIKVEVQSRHRNSKTYRCYIDYLPHGKTFADIRRYSCDCPNGNRTVGCCSHIAAVIYYLSYARYQSRIIKPAIMLAKLFEENNTYTVINSDSDED